ncbi:MAG: helix-turn-helix transcriptional regulator, partial [Lachnospiraceae bacterium]|nr:helix-turn-helix transcriptional regulator [Lachnospiraceae bacterium]
MKLNDVIRKYRKENNLTQEEMAARLGVSAPAVNKWESGASMPDITLLAPIARLLHISLDELLSFKENLSEAEVNAKISEIYGMMVKDPIETVFSKINEMVREYPNADYLILNLAMILYTQTLLMKAEEREKYVCWVRETFEKL